MHVTLSFPRHPMPDRMRDSNPYRAPESRVAVPDDTNLEVVIAGQKLVILAAQVYFLSAAARMFIGAFAFIGAFISLVLALVGIVRLGRGMGDSTATKALYVVLMFIPVVGLIVLLVLNSRATRRLQAAGHHVGFLGVDR